MGAAVGAYLHQPEEGELRWTGETSTYFLATGEQTGGAFTLVDEQAKRGESVPLHLHRDDMESFYVVEGEIMLYIGDQPGVRAKVGSFAHLPGGTVHGRSDDLHWPHRDALKWPHPRRVVVSGKVA